MANISQVLSDLGSAYINARYSQPMYSQQPIQAQPAFLPPAVLGGAAIGALGGALGAADIGVPFVDVISQPPVNPKTGKPYTNAVYSPTRGWYIKRRGRRRLMTNRDYNDLLRIQTLKNTDNVKQAIAKLGC